MRWWSRIFRPRQASLGARGEAEAARFLRRQRYRILERNLEIGDDEADLVALDPDGHTIVICEVKTREDDVIAPEQSVNAIKQHRMTRLAMKLQHRAGYRDRPLRFDVITIVWKPGAKPALRHIPGAFVAR